MDKINNRQVKSKSKELTSRQWIFQDSGAKEPAASSFEKIFSAYRDYRNSQQWE